MFHLEDVLQIKDQEDVRFLIRRHPITLFPGLCLALLCIVVPFFFLFPLFSWKVYGVILFLLLVGSGIALALRTFLLWDADVFVITTYRIVEVDQRGILSRFVTEAPLTSLGDISWKRHGLMDTLFRTGTLIIQTSNQTTLEVPRIAHPERIQELLHDLQHATLPKRTDLSPERRERLRKLNILLEQLTEASLLKVEEMVRTEGRTQAVASFLDEDKDS